MVFHPYGTEYAVSISIIRHLRNRIRYIYEVFRVCDDTLRAEQVHLWNIKILLRILD